MSGTLTAPPVARPSIGGLVASADPRQLAAAMMPPRPSPADDRRRSHEELLRRWVGMANIAEDETLEDRLEELASRTKGDYEIDEASRSDWKTKYRQWLDCAMQIATEKTFPWPKASNVIYPLVTVGAVMFNARAYPAIIRDRDVVKGVVLGSDNGTVNPAWVEIQRHMQMMQAALAQQSGGQPPGLMPGPGMPPPGMVGPGMGAPQGASPAAVGEPAGGLGQMPPQWLVEPGAKQLRADRIARHMSWQLLDQQEEWEPQTDQLLIVLPIVGTYFRKNYHSPSLNRNVSETVSAMNLCVNYHAKSFETAPRHTEIMRLYPWDIEESIRSGLFLDHGDGASSYGQDSTGGEDAPASNDEDAPVTFLEQHRRWDLDGDGYAEPYVVTIARDSGRLARIAAGYDMETIDWTNDGRIRRVGRVEIYTKYGFIPNPESKVYDIGFGHLLYPINESVNTALNQMFDAGSLQNVGGGFIGSGLSLNAGNIRFQMGEYIPVNTLGGTIRDNIYSMPFAGPSAIMMQLLTFLIEAGERIASVKDVMVGDMPGDNTSGITTLAVIEQGLQVFSAIYRRVHRSLGYDFRKLYRLNRIHGLEHEAFGGGDDADEIQRADYEKGGGVEPISDPRMVTDMQRLGRAQFMLTFKDDPRVNGGKIILDAFRAAMVPNAEGYMNNAPPQPDPKVLLKDRELSIREHHGLIEAESTAAHTKSLIIKDIAQAELLLAQARKLDNDIQLGWVEAHIEHLKAQVDGFTAYADAVQQAASGASNGQGTAQPSAGGG